MVSEELFATKSNAAALLTPPGGLYVVPDDLQPERTAIATAANTNSALSLLALSFTEPSPSCPQ